MPCKPLYEQTLHIRRLHRHPGLPPGLLVDGQTKQIERRAESVGVRAQENRHVAGVHIFQDLVDLVLRIINIVDIGCVYVRSDLDFLAGTISAIALRSVTPVTT